jgi:hypothetical protein
LSSFAILENAQNFIESVITRRQMYRSSVSVRKHLGQIVVREDIGGDGLNVRDQSISFGPGVGTSRADAASVLYDAMGGGGPIKPMVT